MSIFIFLLIFFVQIVLILFFVGIFTKGISNIKKERVSLKKDKKRIVNIIIEIRGILKEINRFFENYMSAQKFTNKEFQHFLKNILIDVFSLFLPPFSNVRKTILIGLIIKIIKNRTKLANTFVNR